VAVEDDAAGIRRQRPGDQVDERRLAGPVRTDQCVAGALVEVEAHVVGHVEPVEMPGQPGDLKPRPHAGRVPIRAVAASSAPSSPRRKNSTASTRATPTPNSHSTGLALASWSSRIMYAVAPMKAP